MYHDFMSESGICPFGDHPFEYEMQAGKRRTYCSDDHQRKATYERRKLRWSTLPERRCARCKVTKPFTDFPGPHSYCRVCHAARARAYRAANPDPLRARRDTLSRYRLTPDTFAEMLARQGNRCAICRTDNPGGQGWHVDHDHTCCSTRKCSCGKCLRGILCTRCNIGVGNFKDDPAIIQAALSYITAYRASRMNA